MRDHTATEHHFDQRGTTGAGTETVGPVRTLACSIVIDAAWGTRPGPKEFRTWCQRPQLDPQGPANTCLPPQLGNSAAKYSEWIKANKPKQRHIVPVALSIKWDFRRELAEKCKGLSVCSAPEQHLWPEPGSMQKKLQSKLLESYVDSDLKICFRKGRVTTQAIFKQYHIC